MTDVRDIFFRLFEEASAARAYFHTWWSLRSLALPRYHRTMDHYEYVDFFHAANSGFLKLTFVSLAKVFDRDSRALGIKQLQRVLAEGGYSAEAEALETRLEPYTELVRKILGIRNKSVSHLQRDITRDQVYKVYGVSPDEIRMLIDTVWIKLLGQHHRKQQFDLRWFATRSSCAASTSRSGAWQKV